MACPASDRCGGTSPRGLVVALHIEKGLTTSRWLALRAWSSAPAGISVLRCTSTAPSSSSGLGSALLPDGCCPGWHLCHCVSVLTHAPPGTLTAMPFPSGEEAAGRTRGRDVSVTSASWAGARLPLQRMWRQMRKYWQEQVIFSFPYAFKGTNWKDIMWQFYLCRPETEDWLFNGSSSCFCLCDILSHVLIFFSNWNQWENWHCHL